MWASLLLATSTWSEALLGGQRPAPIDAIRDATVLIEVLGPRGRSTGSGFVVAEDGTVATAAHVIQGAWLVRVRLASGDFVPVSGVRDIDEQLDLALLALPPRGVTPVGIGDSDSLHIGQRLLALGCPFGLEVSVADGLLSAVHSGGPYRLLQISIPVSPGSSGGPVFTEDGRVVGLVVSGMRGSGAENINFALPFNYVRGRMTTAFARAPTPLTELPRTNLAALETVETDPGRGPLPPVNSSLAVNFARVDGVEILSQWKRQDGVQFGSLLKVGLALSPTGDVVVERLRETRVTDDGEVGREVHRTLFRVGSGGADNRFSNTVEFTAVNGRAKEYASTLEVRGEQYVVTDMRGTHRVGRAPRGILPTSFTDLVLAAQDDTPTSGLEFLVLDPYRERLVAARFEFAGHARRKIPIAKRGTSCNGKVSVTDTEMDVLVGTQEVGLERRAIAVLATAPYLILDDHVKCVRLPRGAGIEDRNQSRVTAAR